MLYLSPMETFKCPICRTKVDEVLVPISNKASENCLVLCENEYVTHAICTNGTKMLFRNTTSMVEELIKSNMINTGRKVYA